MADMSRKKGARFILDTSGEALHEAFARGGIYLAKPSKHELELFAGHSLDAHGLHDAAIALIARGCVENLVVSLGSEGALLANADGVLQLPSISVEARSAVGAGDSFVAAMTWQLSQGKPVVDAFRFGVAAGAAAVMTSGTQLCRRSDVQRLFEQLKQAPG
jgi:6-phosphofructokinase 2